jgi:hypothetical protein
MLHMHYTLHVTQCELYLCFLFLKDAHRHIRLFLRSDSPPRSGRCACAIRAGGHDTTLKKLNRRVRDRIPPPIVQRAFPGGKANAKSFVADGPGVVQEISPALPVQPSLAAVSLRRLAATASLPSFDVSLQPFCCHGLAATASQPHGLAETVSLPRSRCHDLAATVSQPQSRCHGLAATVSLPRSRFHDLAATVSQPRSRSHRLAATVSLPRSCCHGLAATVLLPRSRCHGLAATVSQPPAPRSHRLSLPSPRCHRLAASLAATVSQPLPRCHRHAASRCHRLAATDPRCH